MWLSNHAQALKLVINRIKNNLSGTLLIAFAIGVSMALPVILYLALNSFDGLLGDVKKESNISVFIALDCSDAALEDITTSLENNTDIKDFHFVSKEEALEALETASNDSNLISSLSENPLPDAFFVEPEALDAASVTRLKNQISNLSGVAEVHIDDAWLQRLNYLLALGNKAMLILATLLGLAIFSVVGNTIRMQILTQQDEIEVSQLIGATNRFIRRPFLYTGAAYGLLGGLCTLLITSIAIILFNQSLSVLAAEYQTDLNLALPNIQISIITCALLIIIGLLSANIAVSTSLSKANK